MPEEITIDEISQDADVPATKRDVAAVRCEVDAMRDSIADLREELLSHTDEMRDEILHHFDVVVENIEHSLRGANADEISLVKDKQADHDIRIRQLERQTSVR